MPSSSPPRRGRRRSRRPRRAARRASSPTPRRRCTTASRYPFASVDALKRAGYFAAPVPAEHGGLGVTSVHDVVVAVEPPRPRRRVGRHRREHAPGRPDEHRAALAHGRRGRRRPPRRRVRRRRWRIAREGAVIAAAISEPGQDLTRPRDHRDAHRLGLAHRRAQVVLHDVAGRDRAVHRGLASSTTTASSATATRQVPARRRRRRDPRRLGRARHARLRQPLGHLHRRRAPARRAARRLPRRRRRAYMERNLVGRAVPRRRRRWASPRPPRDRRRPLADRGEPGRARAQMLVAENAIELGACRASLARAALSTSHADAGEGASSALRRDAGGEDLRQRGRRARSSTARSRSPAAPDTSTATRSRALYRDVRAGGFMHPLGANRAYELVGDVSLGHVPSVH